MTAVDIGPMQVQLQRDIGRKVLFYDHLRELIEEGSVNSSVAQEALQTISKATLALGVLSTRPWGVRDFRYRFEALVDNRGELVMQLENHSAANYARCRVQFIFSEDGYLADTPTVRVEYIKLP